MKTLALFDFDHTLYKKDSLLEFTKFYKGKTAFYLGLLLLSPHLILMKLKLVSNEKAKQKFINYFFGNNDLVEFNAVAEDFALRKIPLHLNQKIFGKFKAHIESGHEVLIVTASAAEWIRPWSINFGVDVIGTRLETIGSKITGKFSSPNCSGNEKVCRIKAQISLDTFDAVHVYGLGKADAEMLTLSKT